MTNYFRSISLTVCFCSFVATAQNMATIDWAKKGFSKSCPSQAASHGDFVITVQNLNNILYTYNVTASADPSLGDDFANVGAFIKAEGAPKKVIIPTAADECNTLYTALSDNLSAVSNAFTALQPTVDSGGLISSIPLATTISAWSSLKSSDNYKALSTAYKLILAKNPPCTPNTTQGSDFDNTKKLMDALDAFDRAVNSPHQASVAVGMSRGADNNVTAHVVELYQGKPTSAADPALTCSIKSSVLTLSGGVLISTIPGRDYVSVKTPGTLANGQASQNVLAVQDNSGIRPAGLFLLNYDLPWFGSDSWGFAVSTGPTVQLTGPTTTSKFGYFFGGSIHIWKRLFLSVGEQIGEFADYPVGFTNGTVIPDSFGSLVPIKRWTLRPSYAISYQTKSFTTSTNNQANSTQTAQAPAKTSQSPVSQPPATKKPASQPVSSTPTVNSTIPPQQD